jgi:Ca-activated chloride channel family protein
MSQFKFEFPYLFLLIFLFIFCQKKCPARNLAIYFPYVHILIGSKALKSIWLVVAKWLTIIFFITALASPVVVTTFTNAKAEARDIMLIVDSSESMLEKGFDESNLERNKFDGVKEVIADFIAKRKSDRIGLINFASSAFIASPLTFDNSYLEDILAKQRVGLVGKRTAIYDALLQGVYILQNSKTKSKIAVLLTDGSDNMSKTTFDRLLYFVKKAKIKLYTIGVGSYQDIDAQKLKELAEAGNGKFFMVNNKKALKRVYKEIDSTQKSKIKSQSYSVYRYYYYFPLIFSIIFLLIYIYFKSVKGIAR